jgi:hypothetical protein
LREELHPQGVEIVTVSLELSGPEASRPFIDLASPAHPSLLDPTHQMDALFGVVNIPNVVWIDERGVIVRPAEPGWPPGDHYPDWLRGFLDERDARAEARAKEIETTDPERRGAHNEQRGDQSGVAANAHLVAGIVPEFSARRERNFGGKLNGCIDIRALDLNSIFRRERHGQERPGRRRPRGPGAPGRPARLADGTHGASCPHSPAPWSCAVSGSSPRTRRPQPWR